MDDLTMSDDPFDDDSDKTLLRPRPSHPQPSISASALPIPEQLFGGVNPIEQAASRLLSILVTIKNASSHPAPNQLKEQISSEMEAFRTRAKKVVGDPKELTIASYVLCTALDEAALNTPWGHKSDWAKNSLLSSFHREVRGGERFFEILKRLGAEPEKNLNLLELMYVCLSLGYEGTYKITKNGQATLQKIRNWLFEILRAHGRASPSSLSVNWEGSNIQDSSLPRMAAIWVALAAALAFLALAFFTLQIKLGEGTGETVRSFYSIHAPALKVRTPPSFVPAAETGPTYSDLLSVQIATGDVSVVEFGNMALVRLVGDNLFQSGKANVDERAIPFILDIAQAVNQHSGPIVIRGHTDNIPIRRPEFPSNLDLSEARAQSVLNILRSANVDNDRLSAEGAGDLEPLNDNSTRELRSRNRRVELSAYY
ncbi:hypothetical protein AB833_15175 [Chromatiales bacterium (ex Bugula neritina AB1)]|nr:hypothetical protein AB833_15175 [Chromatiales bacterium (ex Bugula neritina AB1)]